MQGRFTDSPITLILVTFFLFCSRLRHLWSRRWRHDDRNTVGGRCTKAMENTLTHTHTTLTHASGAVDTEEALDTRGNAKGKRQASG